MIFHPSDATLSRYGDGELTGMRARRVAAHLERCADCRVVIARLRALGESARSAPAPAMHGGVWARIAERRGGGERVILPVETERTTRRSTRWVAVAAAVVVIAGVVVAWPSSRGAAAGEPGRLTFTPAIPSPGSDVSVRYRADASLADESSLRLRARFYTPSVSSDASDLFGPRGVVVGSLARGADGSFSGTFHLPDSAVYALVIVENGDGSRIDNDHRALFDLVAAAPNGRSSFSGLVARAMRRTLTCCMPDPGGRALAAADSLVAIYPDSAQSWLLQVSVQGASRIPHWLRVFSARERRFAALEKSLGARATVSPAEMEAMASFASLIEDSAAAARWRTRLLETYPSDPRTLWIVSFDQRLNGPDSARKELPRFETAWRSRSDARVLIVESGLMMAIQSTDSSAIERWTSRYAELPAPPFFVPESERRFEDPVLRTAVQRQLTATVRTLLAEPRVSRDLYYTREQDSLRRRFVAADALVIQSDAMLSAAQPRLALDTMNVAVGLISGAALPVCGSGSVYRGRAKVQFVLGDSASGRRDLAFGARTDSLPGRTCVRWAAAP